MMADDAASNESATATAESEPRQAGADAIAAPQAKPAEEAEPEAPQFDPARCKGIAIGLDAFLKSMAAGEWDGTDFAYYLEPAGVLHGPLRCTRSTEEPPPRAGLLMTRAGWQAKKLALDDAINPPTYELSFPKEFGYVKPLAHYSEEAREHAKFPWSKKY